MTRLFSTPNVLVIVSYSVSCPVVILLSNIIDAARYYIKIA